MIKLTSMSNDKCFTLDAVMSIVNNHPVHIIGQNGSLMPSAFIPFCSLGTKFALLGEYLPNMTFPVCNMFQPTVYKGQLCYSLEIRKNIYLERELFQGKESGLMLILDTNSKKGVDLPAEIKDSAIHTFEEGMSLADVPRDLNSLARIHIGTLAPFTGYGPGDYKLASLKQITGTESFLAKPNFEKKCTDEQYEKCQIRNVADQNRACGCKPFELSSVFPNSQVIINKKTMVGVVFPSFL